MVRAPGSTTFWGTVDGSTTTVSMSTLYAAYIAGELYRYQVYTTSDPDTPCSPAGLSVVEECWSEQCFTISSKGGASATLHASGLFVDYDEHYPVHFIVNHPPNVRYLVGTRSGIKHSLDDKRVNKWEFAGSSMTYQIPLGMALTSAYGLICGA